MSGPSRSLPAVTGAAAFAGREPPSRAWAAASHPPLRNRSRRRNAVFMESNIEHLLNERVVGLPDNTASSRECGMTPGLRFGNRFPAICESDKLTALSAMKQIFILAI